MLKKTVNLVALMMLVGTNVLSPFSYAGEIGTVSEGTIDANLQTENFYETQSGNTQDSSVKSQNDEKDSQNDGIVVPLGERGYGEAEGIFSGEEEKILSPSDSSFQKGAQEEVTQNSQQFTQLDGVEGVPLDAKNDEGKIQNDDTDLEDMPKILVDEISPIDLLTLELEKSEQPQVQDVSTVIDYYPDSNVRYTLNGNENFTAGTITITDGTDTITILDRNLGATAAGTGCHYKTNGETYCSYDDTYGYHFQWGNNHGFKPGCDLSGSTNSCSDSIASNAVSGQVDATTISYNPANQEYYNSGVFYKGSRNWLNDSNKVNLWGGSTGDSTTFVELTEEQAKLRQGPCPKGFHVPSVGELVKLSSMMTGSSDSEKDVQLHNLLYIPYAGFRNLIDAYVYDMGYYTYLWSSSPSSSNNNISWNYNILDPTLINYYISRGSRADAYSIRCFYDKYETYEAPEVDTIHPAKPEIGCPDYDEVLQCVSHNGFCPQYDFDDDGVVDDYDIALLVDGICTSDNSFINENKDLTNNENPKLMRKTPGGVEWVEEIGGYEIQICSDSGCNNVIHSGSHEDVVGHTDLSDGMYYRRVKAIDIAGNEGEWSDIWLFTVHTTPPAKPEIRCPSEDEVTRGMMFENTPQYDFDGDGQLTVTDVDIYVQGVCTTDNAYINEDKDITNSKNPRLVWTIPGEDGVDWIEGYEIQICGDSSCNNVVYSGTYEEMIQNELSDGKYYWRVKAVDIFGSRGEWSNIWSFTVDTIVPVKPEMGCPDAEEVVQCLDFGICPQYDFDGNGEVDINDLDIFLDGVCTTNNTYINENNDITNNKNPKFVRSTPGGVEGVEEIGGYEMQICSDSGCNNVIHSGSYEEVVGHTDLDDGKYYWRVKTIDKAGNEGEWSDILSFTVDAVAPVKTEIGFPTTGEVMECIVASGICPQYDFNGDGKVNAFDYKMLLIGVLLSDNTYINENNDITNSKNPRFVRSTPGGAEGVEEIGGYEMQICSDSGCNTVIHSGSYEEVVGHTDLDDGKYYWRVKTIDKAGNEGERSDILSFTVDTIAPVKPEIGCPDADEVLRSVTMRVYCPQYDFDLNGRLNANDAALVLKGICTSGDNDIFIKSDGAVTRNKTPRLVRSTPGGVEGGSEIGGYEVQICSDSECNNVAYSGSYEEIIQNELLDGKYYWRVKALDKAGNEGERSDILSFTVDTEVPSKPEMGVPTTGEIYNCILDDQYCPQYDFDKNGRVTTADLNMFQSGVLLSDNTFIKENEDITNSKNPRLVRKTPGGVEGVSEIGGYEIQICRDSGCNNVAYSGSYEEIVQNELSSGKYYWRVKAIDRAGNEGEWSDILSFTVTGDEEKKSGGSSGGGGRRSKTSDIHPISSQNDNSVSSGAIAKDLRGDTQDSSNKSSERQEILSSSDSHNSAGQVPFTNDQKEAYEFAKSNGITTTSSIEKAKMNTTLTRIQMAKMLSNFAINVMKQEPDVSKGIIKFNDVTNKMNKQYDYAVTKAYQLGIMGQNVKSNNFRPNDEVTRAEFATALSRLLYNTSDGEYKSTSRYYIPHIKKLMQKGIITKDDPKMKEKRGYVMIMLMRSVK